MDLKGIRIGNVNLISPVIIGPMAGVTDLPYRVICAERGAGLICMEMVSAKAILYGNKKSEGLLATDPKEKQTSLQLFGSDPAIMGEITKRMNERPYDIIDFNMGCPVPKIVGNGEGSALMKDPVLAAEIISAMVKASDKPVTVKIRKGFDEGHINAVEIAKAAEESGAAAIAVHGRTREQYYSGRADWDIIKKVKEAVNIPVIGNGDVTDGESALKMMNETGCDGVMVARAAMGNPWIVKEIEEYLKAGISPARPSRREMRDTVLEHAALLCDHKGEYIAIKEMRKHAAWYTAGMPHSSAFRVKINNTETFEELKEAVEQVFSEDEE